MASCSHAAVASGRRAHWCLWSVGLAHLNDNHGLLTAGLGLPVRAACRWQYRQCKICFLEGQWIMRVLIGCTTFIVGVARRAGCAGLPRDHSGRRRVAGRSCGSGGSGAWGSAAPCDHLAYPTTRKFRAQSVQSQAISPCRSAGQLVVACRLAARCGCSMQMSCCRSHPADASSRRLPVLRHSHSSEPFVTNEHGRLSMAQQPVELLGGAERVVCVCICNGS